MLNIFLYYWFFFTISLILIWEESNIFSLPPKSSHAFPGFVGKTLGKIQAFTNVNFRSPPGAIPPWHHQTGHEYKCSALRICHCDP